VTFPAPSVHLLAAAVWPGAMAYSLAAEAGTHEADEEFDAAGPDKLAFFQLVNAIRAATGYHTRVVTVSQKLVLAQRRS
jgi:hypothetical protein